MKRLALLLFFLSGALGLVYEVVWTRTLTHVFGSTAVAVGTVLAAFMAGLAVGGWLLGRAADRSSDPLRLYAWLELGVAFAALAAHVLLNRIEPAYVRLYGVLEGSQAALGVARFVLAFGLVMLPTVLMGATLPVLARFVVTRLPELGERLSSLYAINTLGAVLGALASGFYLIGEFGLNRTVHIAVLGNLAIGAVAWAASGRARLAHVARPEPSAAPPPPPGVAELTPGTYRLLLAGLALSGLTAFAYEIYWTRSLVFLLGSSTYAVTSMLAAFLAGIALGAYLARFLLRRVRNRVALFGWVQILIGVTSAMALPTLFAAAEPDTIRAFLGASAHETGRLFASRIAVALAVMIVPATLVGTTFPIVARTAVQDLSRTGATVGKVYAVNTLGNVAGALLPGLVLLHWLGIQRGILLMATINAAVGVLLLLLAARTPVVRWAVVGAAVVAGVLLGGVPLAFQFPSESQREWHRVLFYREGPSATTMVLLDPDTGEKSMCVDGIEIGGSGFTDYKQQLLAHLPKLLVDDVSSELSVGLGSGILAGESARHARVREITCVEIEPSVVAGAAWFFTESHGVLRDPRLDIVVDDVSSHLRTTTDRYHVVSADEKTAQEYASNGFSYSREYYALVREHLEPGGLVVQWVPTTLPPSQYRMVLRTFTGVFPEAQLWYFPPAVFEGAANTLLVGSNESIGLDLARMRRYLDTETEAFAGLMRYGLTTAEAVLAHFVAEGEALRSAVRGAPENTADHPRYEFFSPADYAVPRRRRLATNHDFLVGLKRLAAAPVLAAAAGEGEDAERLRQALAAEEEFLAGFRAVLRGAPDDDALARLDAAVAAAPWNESLRARVFLQYWLISGKYCSGAGFPRAAELMGHALSLYGQSAISHVNYSIVLARIGNIELAIAETRTAVALDPDLVAARRTLAGLLQDTGRGSEAAEQWRALLELEPNDADARRALSMLSRAGR